MVFAMATIFVMALMTSTVGECKLVPTEEYLKEKGAWWRKSFNLLVYGYFKNDTSRFDANLNQILLLLTGYRIC